MKITKKIATKIRDTVDAGLCKGVGQPVPGQMCVEAAVCYALGMPHGDNPACVGSAVRSLKITLNDCEWSSNAARAKGMRKLAVAQVGSDTIDQMAFGKACFLRGVQTLLPHVFRKFAAKLTKPEDKDLVEKIAVECEAVKTLKEARAVAKTAYAYASAYASASAYAYAYASAYASASASASAYAYASAFFKEELGDEFLTMVAGMGLSVLVEMKSPGCKFLSPR